MTPENEQNVASVDPAIRCSLAPALSFSSSFLSAVIERGKREGVNIVSVGPAVRWLFIFSIEDAFRVFWFCFTFFISRSLCMSFRDNKASGDTVA